MIKTSLKYLCLAGVCAMALGACAKKKELSPLERVEQAFDVAAKSTGDGDPAIWKMSDEDTDVYLYGTVHILRPETKWKTDVFTTAFESADKLYLEADLTSPEAMASMQQAMMSNAQFSDGQTMKTVLTEEQYGKLSATLDKMGVPSDALDGFKPWFASLQLMVGAITQNGYDPTSGVDSQLAAAATSNGKSFGYFETGEFQANLLAGGSMEDQVEALMFQIDTLDKTPEMLDKLVAEWADGDVKGLGVLMGDPAMFGSVDGYNAMIKDRNVDWVPKIEAILDEPGTKFVAVGAGHLAGPDSVITLLEKKGHKLEVVQ